MKLGIKLWVARDQSGLLIAHSTPPSRLANWWKVPSITDTSWILSSTLFPELTWEDEPLEVEV